MSPCPPDVALDLAPVLIELGAQQRAEVLLDMVMDTVLTSNTRLGMRGYGITDVARYALLGQTDEALTALEVAVDAGWRGDWQYAAEYDSNLNSIRDDPRFQAAFAVIEADMATQLANVREMEASGELEPIPEPVSH